MISFPHICGTSSMVFHAFLFSVVYAIREAATKNLKKLVEKFGVDWAQVEVANCFRETFILFLFRHPTATLDSHTKSPRIS